MPLSSGNGRARQLNAKEEMVGGNGEEEMGRRKWGDGVRNHFRGRGGVWCQEPFYFTLGFQPKQSGQISIYITLQTWGQLAQLPPDQGARQRDQPMQPKNRGNAQPRCRKILLA
jgi:hypothetical protein